MIVYDNITHWNEEARELHVPKHLKEAYHLGKNF